MRVLTLFEYATLNGGERSFLATAKLVQQSGIRLTAAVPQSGPLRLALAEQGIEVIPWPSDSLDQGDKQARRRQAIGQLLRETNPAVAHSNSLAMSRLVGPVAKSLGYPSIGHVRDIVRLSRQAVDDVNQNSRLLFVSQATARFHQDQGVNAAISHVVYNGIANAEPTLPPSPWPIPTTAKVIGVVGQIGLRKGVDTALSAFEAVCGNDSNVHLAIVGERFSQKEESVRYESSLRERSDQGCLAGRVHWLGWRNDLPSIYARLSLLLHAAHQEPFGRVLLEAAAHGVPVVATDVGGTRELFGDDGALLVSPNSASQLAAGAARLLADPGYARRLSQRALQRVGQQFTIERAAQSLVSCYREV